ncbi:hypothetical protein KUH03_23725 [Sphingobacterium sp. E70]|uniref:hypothetical protein n=1 Tax=Sphingobacterium sp. E70 TaxID=2853439 RepID=UPI00211C2D16|nr:hypothetical protein [Sphingobacterium sp. E70]ULT22417.1 hypothetical protein KUH03_23725 [Sphingobacterium sp. E70]
MSASYRWSFFAIASSVANIEGDSVLGRIIGMMSLVFVIGIVVAGVTSVIFLYLFPVSSDLLSNKRRKSLTPPHRTPGAKKWSGS